MSRHVWFIAITFAVVLLTLVGWSFVPPPFQARQEGKLEITSGQALQRKHRSEALLRREAVPINQSLPVIETESEAHLRSKQEVAYRALALLVVAIKAEGLEQPIVEKLIEQYGLTPYFTPKETAFIRDPTPSKVDRTQFTWRYESAWVMLWALGYVEDLGKPSSICDVSKAVTIMKERTSAQFLADAKLRSSLRSLMKRTSFIATIGPSSMLE